jgi:signal transduction histidine kinase/integral membrane sensor domain MASE1
VTGPAEPAVLRALRVAAVALAVAAGYYVGVRIGLVLRLPPATPSILWPPNAFLAAVLLLSPPRRWAIYLLAALPVHLAAVLPVGWPAPMVVLLFVTNCGEALLAAGLIRTFSDAPTRFDTVRRVSVFFAAAVAAPFLTSFPDAAAVSWLGGETFSEVWRTRFMSNVVAELLLIPPLVIGAREGWHRLRGSSPRRIAEAALVGLAMVAIGLWVFAAPAGTQARIGGSRVTLILPVLLLATVRFGTAGASFSLLGTGLISLWAGTQGRGPFSGMPADDGVVTMQLVLVTLGAPLLLLAGALGERRATREQLEERLGFEELISRLAGAFVHLPGQALRETVEEWLQRLGEWLGADRVSVLTLSATRSELSTAYCWAPGGGPASGVLSRRDLPSVFDLLRREEVIRFPARHGSDASAAAGEEWARYRQVRSILALPLVAGGRVLGAVCFSVEAAARHWPEDLERRLELVAAVLGSALARQEAEDGRKESEAIKTAILASLPSWVAVLDRDGRVTTVNESWNRIVNENEKSAKLTAEIGVDYVELCSSAPVAEPAALAAGIAAVLAGERTSFAMEYPHPSREDDRWFGMTVVPLRRAEGGAVVACTDITGRKRAELEALRSRDEMAHLTRVSTLGVMTVSLAHEVNQPLTGILTNAQAAQRLLAAAKPDDAELDQILRQIVSDVKRASEVIRHLRELLRKGGGEPGPVDLNQVVDDVVSLLHSDAVIRGVSLSVDLASGPLEVMGDRVQLQQVVLNLVANALETFAEGAGGERSVMIRTATEAGDTARVSIEDTGPGLSAATVDRVFEPFFTTKPKGLGMGLSIARSLVVSHGGILEAGRHSSGGASFQFTVPLAGGERS